MVLGGALVAGTLLAQGTHGAPPAAAGDQPPQRIYAPVTAETLGIASSAQQLRGAFVKVPDAFYEEVTAFPNDALRAGITPDKYYAFRTRPDGSDLICFVPLDNPDLATLKVAGPPRGARILIMGRVGPRSFIGDGGATSFAVDRVFLGHGEARRVLRRGNRSSLRSTDSDQPGNIVKQEFTIEKAGQRYLIHDASDPQNATKDIYVTLQF